MSSKIRNAPYVVTRLSIAVAALFVFVTCDLGAADLLPDMLTTEAVLNSAPRSMSLKANGKDISYAASFKEYELKEDGRTLATISATSYIQSGIKGTARDSRPVVFAFNGGPGASSSPLHFGALGPRRWVESPGKGREIVTNAFSLIDVADLVFIDPVGTGFSRLKDAQGATRYWNVEGDAKAALTIIRTWLTEQKRNQSPIYIVGESYGGFRLATMAKDLGDLNVTGLILISPLLDASASADDAGNDLPQVFQLPTLAAAAWHHGKIDRKGRTVEAFYNEAAAFAQSDYLIALHEGSSLPATRRAQLAARVSAFIGLPAAMIEASQLRIDSEQFLRTLLADRQLLVGRLDTRVTAPKPTEAPKDPSRPPAADDPALGLKGSNVIRSAAIKEYLAKDLGVQTARDYLSLTLEVNFRWNWQSEGRGPFFYINPTPNIAKLMQRKPALRVMLLGGYFDLATPVLGPRHSLLHAGLPSDRLTVKYFAAGHSPFEGDANLAAVSEVVHAFVRP